MWGSVSIMVESPSLNFFQQRYPTRPLLLTGAVSVLPPSRTFHTLSPSPQSTARGTDSHKGVSAHPESSLIGLLSLPPSQPRREHWSSPLALGCAPSSPPGAPGSRSALSIPSGRVPWLPRLHRLTQHSQSPLSPWCSGPSRRPLLPSTTPSVPSAPPRPRTC